jgi:hypothetical protein
MPKGVTPTQPIGTLTRDEAHASKEARIDFMTEVMAANQWVTGSTGRQLAKLWDLSYETIRKDAAEASRRFVVDPEERDALKARWHSKVENAQREAVTAGRFEALASLLKLEGDHLGAFKDTSQSGGAQRIEVVFTDGAGDPNVGDPQ